MYASHHFILGDVDWDCFHIALVINGIFGKNSHEAGLAYQFE